MENNKIYQVLNSVCKNGKSSDIKQCAEIIKKQYTDSNRHYHTLNHVLNLLLQVNKVTISSKGKYELSTVAIFHDIIYNPVKKDNELQSALFAKKWLTKLKADTEFINIVCKLIEATAKHESENKLSQLFNDMDLSILGAETKLYKNYCAQIRMEYSNTPYLLYKIGRKRFLKSMLLKPRIFLTEQYKKLENPARINMLMELKTL